MTREQVFRQPVCYTVQPSVRHLDVQKIPFFIVFSKTFTNFILLTHKHRFYEKTIKLRHYPPPVILAAFLTSAMTVFLFTSCSRTELAPMQYDTPDSRLLTDIRSNLPETIRVFDPAEFFPPDTKADCGLPVDIPSDALDYGNASTLSNSLYDYVQIPIHARISTIPPNPRRKDTLGDCGIKDIPHSPKPEGLLLDRRLHRHHHTASGLHDTGTARQPRLLL